MQTRMRSLALWVPVLSILSLSVASRARAEASAADKASAEALFNEGIAQMRAGHFADGCAKFEGSQALDPTLGTELRLADCYEKLGKTASAWALFKECQGLAHRNGELEREALAREHVDALAPRLSFLIIESSEPQLVGLHIERNGRPLPVESLGSKIPVDPGAQNITVSAPARQSWSTSVGVPGTPTEVRVRVPRLTPQEMYGDLVVAPAAALVPVRTEAPARTAVATPLPQPVEPPRTQRTVGIVISSVGMAGVLSGLGLGWYAKHENDRSRTALYCPEDDHNGCNADGLALRSRARTFATASTVTLAAGGALLATGIVLWSTAPNHRERQTTGVGTALRLNASAAPGSYQATLRASF